MSWFSSNRSKPTALLTDVHSHLLPGLDDGVKSFWEAESILLRFIELGYKKVVTTPHVMHDHYKNTPELILAKLEELRNHVKVRNIPIQIEAAAEYYLDEHLVATIERDDKVLTFGNNYLLFETNFINEPLNIRDFIFAATTRGYTPVLAHPERYLYLHNSMSKLKDLVDRGVLLQVNSNSILGLYSREIQTFSYKLIKEGYVHFLGSDCHNPAHMDALQNAHKSRQYRKALELPLLNNSL